MPELYRRFGAEWVDMHSGWELVDWSYDTLPALRNQELFDAIPAIGVNAGGGKADVGVPVQQADIASYELLEQFGGVYLNCDMAPVRSIEPLCAEHAAWVAMETATYPSNAAMAAEPGHPFFAAVIDTLPKRFWRMGGASMNEQTGPHLLAEVAARHDVHRWPVHYFCGSGYDAHHTGVVHPEAYAVHHWGHQIPDAELWQEERA